MKAEKQVVTVKLDPETRRVFRDLTRALKQVSGNRGCKRLIEGRPDQQVPWDEDCCMTGAIQEVVDKP